ncbi:MAG: IS30 family transposase [Eubacteriales bacterium]
MGKKFSHLSRTQRFQLEALSNRGIAKQDIADELGVHVSTIYRELGRATMEQLTTELVKVVKYNPDEAHRKYKESLSAKGAPLKIGSDFKLANYIEEKILKDDFSPAAALGEIAREQKSFETSICTSTLYAYIEKGVFATLTNADLPVKKNKTKKYKKVKTVKRPPSGESIEKRPEVVSERTTFGHWEGDTVYSGKETSKKALFVLTERLTRKEIIEPIKDRTARSVVEALNRVERRYGENFKDLFLSITVDNGSEFSDVARLENSVLHEGKRTQFYYCHPYRSCERGSNENQNKLIRRKYPKGTDFSKVSSKEIKVLEKWINEYPRKIFNWKTSDMMFKINLDTIGISL